MSERAITFSDLIAAAAAGLGPKAEKATRPRSLSFPALGATEIDGIVAPDYVWVETHGLEAFQKAIADRADVRRFEHLECPASDDARWQGGDGAMCPFCGEDGGCG